MIATSQGSVFTWGRNHLGQLGHGNRVDCLKPRLVKGNLATKHVVQVAAGRAHTLLLCRTGELFGCGDGSIGNGDVLGSLTPSPINHVYGSPIKTIVCGETHSMLLTNGGVVWSWGSNSFGQLGSGNGPENIYRPNVVKSLNGAKAVQIACGSFHNLLVTEEGRVWAWGKAADGQLGHGEISATVVSQPRVISELLGTRIVHVAAGRRHSLFIDDQRRMYSSGIAGVASSNRPIVVDAMQGAQAVFCGSFSSFAIFGQPLPTTKTGGVFFLDEEKLQFVESMSVEEAAKNAGVRAELSTLAETAFSFAGSVNGSFLDPETFFATNGEGTPGINLERAHRFMLKLDALGAGEALANAWSRLIRNSLDSVSYKSAENMRVWLLAFFNPAMLRPDRYFVVIERLLVSMFGLRERPKKILFNWLSTAPLPVFETVAKVIQIYIAYASSHSNLKQKATTGALVLDAMRQCRRHLPPSFFYNQVLSRNMDPTHELQLFRQGPTVFSWLRYAFLLDAAAKAALVGIAFKGQPYVSVLAVRRSHLLEDTLSQVHSMSNAQLRQPIRVVFAGEQGLDEGGPSRELFQLLLEQILNPDFGLFRYNELSGKYWFSPDGAHAGSAVLFELIGVIVGLAIANTVILNLRLPSVCYDKMLKQPVLTTESRLERLREIDPALAKGLSDLLAMDEDQVESLGLVFSISRSYLGETKTVDLLPNGANESVTANNARRYIDLYADYCLHLEVDASFSAFQRGFLRVVGDNPVVSLLNAAELQQLVEGQGDVPIRLLDLRPSTLYAGFAPNDPVIDNFWAVVSEFSQEQAKQFLLFCFGSSSVPIQGLRAQRFAIQKSGDDPTRLPASHTCAGVLDLPVYRSRDELASKLMRAISEGATGFELV